MSDDVLAYRMIKSASLSEQDERVVKATCKLAYGDVKDKLKSIFGEAGSSKSDLQTQIKTEDVFDSTHEVSENSTLYTKSRGKYPKVGYKSSFRGARGSNTRLQNVQEPSSSGSSKYQNDREFSPYDDENISDEKNPLDSNGIRTQCVFCKSI